MCRSRPETRRRSGQPALIARAEALAYLPAATRAMAGLFPVQQFVLLRQVEPAP